MRLLAQVLSLAFSIAALAALTLRATPGCSTKEGAQPQQAPAAQAPQPAASPPAPQPAPVPPTTPPPATRFMPASKAGPIFVAPTDPLFPPSQNPPPPKSPTPSPRSRTPSQDPTAPSQL